MIIMAFRTDKETAKWAEIQGAASTTFDKMLEGAATPQDLKGLGTVLAKYDQLAAQLFEDQIASVEATADTIVDKLNADRIALGKRPLTPKAHDRVFKQTFQQVLAEATVDIVGSLKDYITEKFDELEDVLEERLDDQEEEVESMFDKLQAVVKATRDQKEAKDTFDKFEQMVNKKTDQGPSLFDRFRSLKEKATEAKSGTLSKVTSLFTKPKPEAYDSLEDFMVARGVKDDAKIGDDIKKTTTVAVDNKINRAVEANNKLRSSVEDEWRAYKSRSEKEPEEKKARAWFREAKLWLSAGKDKLGTAAKGAKGFFGGAKSLISKLMAPLVVALTAPQLIKTIADNVRQYLNFETISKFMGDQWKSIKEGGSAIIDWLVDKVRGWFGLKDDKGPSLWEKAKGWVTGKETPSPVKVPAPTPASARPKVSADEAKSKLPELQTTLASLKARLKTAQQKEQEAKRNGTELSLETKTTLAYAPHQIAKVEADIAYYRGAASPTTTASVVAKPATMVSTQSVAPMGGATSTGPAPAAILASSSVPTTTVVPEVSASFKDGITIPDPAVQPPQATQPEKSGLAATNGVSISSFGLNPGDDMLHMLNMGSLVS